MANEKDHDVRVKRVTRGFTMVQNAFLDDATLSWKAKCIFIYMISKPEGWKLNIKGDLVKRSTDGAKSVYSGIVELVNARYISRTRSRDFSITYHLFENKEDNDTEDYLLSRSQNGDSGKGDSQNSDSQNGDGLVIPKDSNTESSKTDVSKVGETPPTKHEESAPSLVEQNSKKFIVNRLLDLGVDSELVAEYWHYREIIKRNRLTNKAVTLVINECARHSFNLTEAIELQIANGWTGFKVQWVHNQKQSFGSGQRPQMSKREAVEAHNAKIAEDLKAKLRGVNYGH